MSTDLDPEFIRALGPYQRWRIQMGQYIDRSTKKTLDLLFRAFRALEQDPDRDTPVSAVYSSRSG